MIGVSPSMFKQIVKRTPSVQAILVAGDHGIGKSSIFKQIAADENRIHIEIFLGQMNDRGDLVGPTVRVGEKKFGFLDPEWWPESKNVDIVLDELNRAEQELHSPIFDFVLNGKMMGRQLPGWGDEDGPRIFAAVNSGDDYFVNEMDPALVDRFNMYRLEITPKDWLAWARDAQLNAHVIRFIDKHQNLLWVKAEGLDKGATPRGWHRAADWLEKNKDLSFSTDRIFIGVALEGIIGSVSAEFVKFCLTSGVTAQDILNMPIVKEGEENPMWDEIQFNLNSMVHSDLIALNAQFASATRGLQNDKIQQYCDNIYLYMQWIMERKFKEVATSLWDEIKESKDAKAVYYCDPKIIMYLSEVIDTLTS